jgi:predicted dehydrogenase
MTAIGVHNLDAMIYLFGSIDEVYCTNLQRVMPRLEDTTSVMLSLANGTSTTLFCSLVTAMTYRFAVYGTKGCIALANQDVEFRFTPTPEAPSTGRHATSTPEISEYRGFNVLAAELEGFAAAIKGERSYPITPEEIIHRVAVSEAIVSSAVLHQPVKVGRLLT